MVVHAGSDVRGKGYATSYRLTLSGSASDTIAGRSRHYKEQDEILQTNIVPQSSRSKTRSPTGCAPTREIDINYCDHGG